jgi:hypothetical protein
MIARGAMASKKGLPMRQALFNSYCSLSVLKQLYADSIGIIHRSIDDPISSAVGFNEFDALPSQFFH